MKLLVFGVDAHCRHGEATAPEDPRCELCEWEDDVLSRRPPFTVRCIDDRDGLRKGVNYTVAATIIEGLLSDAKASTPCFLLKVDDGSATLTGYPVRRFQLVNNA